MTEVAEKALKIRNYVYFAEVGDGVLFEAGSKSFVLKGANIYPFVSKIIHFIDSGFGWQAIIGNIPEKLRPLAGQLFEQLTANNMLIDATFDRTVREKYAAHPSLLEFARYLEDSIGERALDAFDQWCQRPIYLTGSGYALKAAVRTLVDSGCGPLTIQWRKPPASIPFQPDPDEVVAIVESAPINRESHVLAIVEQSTAASDSVGANELRGQIDDWGLRFGASEQAHIFAGHLNAHLVVSPVADRQDSKHQDVRNCLARHESTTADAHSPAAFSMVGNIAALNLMRHHFGIDANSVSNDLVVVSPALELSAHPILPSSFVTSSSTPPTSGEFEQPHERELIGYERIDMAVKPLFDPVTGPLSRPGGGDLAQMPLFHDAIDVRAVGRSGKQQVIAWGASVEDAGLRTLGRALAILAGDGELPCVTGVSAGFDEVSWRRRATALHIIRQPDFLSNATIMHLNSGHIRHPVIQMLVRLLAFSGVKDLRFVLAMHKTWPAVYSACRIDGAWGAGFVGSSCIEAATEALGAVCSTTQLGSAAQWQDVAALELDAGPVSEHSHRDFLNCIAAESSLVEPPVQERRYAGLNFGNECFVGSVELGEK